MSTPPCSAGVIGAEIPYIVSATDKVLTGSAFDGTNMLGTFVMMQNGKANPYAQLMTPSGTLGSVIEISNTLSIGSIGSPCVAFGETNYLVAMSVSISSSATDLYGQFISKLGALVGSPFVISSAAGSQNASGIVFDGNNYLVVWTDTRKGNEYDVYGQLVSPSGSLVGSEIAISTDTQNQKDVAVAFNGTDYLVAWNDGRRLKTGFGEDIYGQIINRSGTLAGANFLINQNDYPSDNPLCIAFDGTNYLVVWMDKIGGASSSQWDLFGQFVAPTGNLMGNVITICNMPGGQFFPTIAFDGTYYLVVWTDQRNDTNRNFHYDQGEGTGSDIYGQLINKSGALFGSEMPIVNVANDQVFGGVSFGTNKFYVGWTDNRAGTHLIYNGIMPSGDIYGASVRSEAEPVTTCNVYTEHYDKAMLPPGYTEYQLECAVHGPSSITSVTVQGPNVPLTSLINEITLDTKEFRWTVTVTLPGKPTVGDRYDFTVTYSNSTNEVINASVTGTVEDFPNTISPAHGSTISTLIPTFRWSALPIELLDLNIVVADPDAGGEIIWFAEINPDSLSAVYNFNGTAPVLQYGKKYAWAIQFRDALHDNSALMVSEFTIQSTGVDEELNSLQPSAFHLSQNFPNPFNPVTTIEYSVPQTQFVTLKIFNTLGEEVATLFEGKAAPGSHTAVWNSSGFASGIYFYRLEAGATKLTKKLLLMK
ncbi:MAG: T9SS type A sorting domain-containing protein [Candidatus Latescibacterota bacterium]